MQSRRANVVVLGLIALLAAGTLLLRGNALNRLEGDIETQQRLKVSRAFGTIDDEFQSIQREMVKLAQEIGDSRQVRDALLRVASDQESARGELVGIFSGLRVPDLMSVELYTPTPRLVAWNGFSLPLDLAPQDDSFLQTFQSSTVSDGDSRAALVIWWPIRDGPRIYGTVRVLRTISTRVPVQNEYLRDYSLDRVWSRKLKLFVELFAGPDAPADTSGAWRQMLGVDGSPVALVRIVPPSSEDLVASTKERFDTVLAFWAALAIVLLLARLYRKFEEARDGPLSQASLWWVAFGVVLWFGRYALLWLRFPERLQRGRSPLAPLFDPTHFASDVFGGALRTSGDLIITALVALVAAASLYRFCTSRAFTRSSWERTPSPLLFAAAACTLVTLYGFVFLAAVTARTVVVDSTLDYFARSGLVPDVLVLAVFAGALVVVGAAVLASAALVTMLGKIVGTLRDRGLSYGVAFLGPLALATFLTVGAHFLWPLAGVLAPRLGFTLLLLFLIAALLLRFREGVGPAALTLRNTLFTVFALAAFLYPLLFSGLQTEKRAMLADAAETFDNGTDPRVVFSIERVLEEADGDSLVIAELQQPQSDSRALDSLATGVLRSSLLASLRSYEVSLTYLDVDGQPRGRHYEADQQISAGSLEQLEIADFELLRAMYTDAGGPEALVEQITGRHERERFRYEGLKPIVDDGERVGWIMAGAEPRSMTEEVGSPFPRVFVSTGFYGSLGEDISLAEFRDGVLVRTTGSGFSRLRLDEDVSVALRRAPSLWQRQTARGRVFETYYLRRQDTLLSLSTDQVVVAARTAATTIFDHLYSLLRLTVAGLFVGIPLYLIGVVGRWRAGQLPAPKVRFRDKVLNAFFAVGIITVAAMGFVGLQVVTGENDRAVESWLKQHLERVESTLAAEARAGELPYRVLDRISIDSLASRVGLDLNLFQGADLVASSRPQLIRDRLIDSRLPVEAHNALSFEGYRFISTRELVGSVTYAAGFRAMPDELGRVRYVISVPTLPEQERIEEERARTVAYLFGALLLLVLVVLATASVLANALTRPIAQLRHGLETVAQGRFEGIKPVDSRDEFGDLVDTFNSMQGQLAESQHRLAQQERQLAWQEMARQVAHEIKNPLTPMKLSVQHLQRALANSEIDDPEFNRVFGGITKTLVEQIDALARIANEFSAFARMPRQVFEPVDANAVVLEAAALMKAEDEVNLRVDLAEQQPTVRADREELRRIYINLLKNAVQSVPEDREPEIEVRTSLTEVGGASYVLCEVFDNGTGVPEDLRDRIFEPNFSTKTSGTGLGLAIVRKAVEDMHGTIGFETEAGVGSNFWVRLPQHTDDAG